MKSDEITLKKVDNSKAQEFINKMYSTYPRNPLNPREFVMVYGEGDDQQLAALQLGTSHKGDDWVEIKFIYTYPHKQGVGKKALQELQDKARLDGIKLELWTWDKGGVPVTKLRKFYSGAGFTPGTKRGPTTMTWEPTNETQYDDEIPTDHTKKKTPYDHQKTIQPSIVEPDEPEEIEEPDTSATTEIFDKLERAGYKLLGQGRDATVWLKDTDPGVVKIIMPEDGQGAGPGAETFHQFYKFCTSHKYSHLENLPKFIKLKKFDIPSDLTNIPYVMVGMEKLNKIPEGSFEEAITWILSDLATKDLKWEEAHKTIKNKKTWRHFDGSMSPAEITGIINDWSKVDKIKWGVLFTLMKVLYQTGKINKQDWDLHTENVMMRDDGALVIIDPWLDA
jgi:GNAT superfamily N-acetyltransferase